MATGTDVNTVRTHRLSSFREDDDEVVVIARWANIEAYAERARVGLPIFSEETISKGGE